LPWTPPGSAYITGETSSTDFPAVVGPDLSYNGGKYDAFVAKVNPSGTALVYAGFLGGSGDGTEGFGIAVDSSGNAYVTGYTEFQRLPGGSGAGFTSYNGGKYDAFVAKVKAVEGEVKPTPTSTPTMRPAQTPTLKATPTTPPARTPTLKPAATPSPTATPSGPEVLCQICFPLPLALVCLLLILRNYR